MGTKRVGWTPEATCPDVRKIAEVTDRPADEIAAEMNGTSGLTAIEGGCEEPGAVERIEQYAPEVPEAPEGEKKPGLFGGLFSRGSADEGAGDCPEAPSTF